jgi:serine protease Do
MTLRTLFRSCLLGTALVLVPSCHARGTSGPPAIAPEHGPCAASAVAAPASEPAPPLAGAPDVAALVARVKPAVVNITTTQEVKVPRMPFFPDWPFGDLFGSLGRTPPPNGRDDEARMKRQALGSGFIVDARGYVVTNAHVVDGADRVRIRLFDDREMDATVKGKDERLDLAVLAIDGAKNLPTVTLGSSGAVRVGDYVIAIGNPFGLGHTVTMGIVSAKDRAIGAGPYDDFIQTDASINPGNSGGPLFDTRGNVIGVNTAINPAGKGIGFAIPVDAVKDVLPQLLEKGRVARGRLGVQIQSVDDAMAKALGLDKAKGALVAEVEPNAAGAKAGLAPGDVIVGFDGQEVVRSQDLPRMVARRAPGSRVKVEVLRDKAKRTFDVTLDELRDAAVRDERADREGAEKDAGTLGLELEDGRDGVVVKSVRPDGPADGALERGDVIIEIDRKPVKDARGATRELRARRTGPVLLRIRRHGATRFVAIEP